MKNIRVFICKNVQFLQVKFSIYLNRRVFVMVFVVKTRQILIGYLLLSAATGMVRRQILCGSPHLSGANVQRYVFSYFSTDKAFFQPKRVDIFLTSPLNIICIEDILLEVLRGPSDKYPQDIFSCWK